MNPEIKKRWVEALRSGLYRQGHHTLRKFEDGVPKDCCLGVLCDLYRQEHPKESGWEDNSFVVANDPDFEEETDGTGYYTEYLPPVVQVWAGLEDENPELTDEHGVAEPSAVWNDGVTPSKFDNRIVPAKSFAEIAEMIERSL